MFQGLLRDGACLHEGVQVTTCSNEAPLHCYYCDRAIVDGNWFARVKLGEGRVALCRPVCVELFLESPDRSEGANVISNFSG